MRFAQVCAGLLLNAALAPITADALADSSLSDRVATAPAAAARSSAEPEAEPPAPVTAVGPGPAFEPETPEPQSPPAPPAGQPRRFQRWTPDEIARVRAALARQRKQMLNDVPHTPGDARAHFTLGVEISAVSRPDDGFERFELGHLSPRFGLFAGYDLVPIREELTLFIELGAAFEQDESDNLLGLGNSAELSSQTLHAGLGLRWDPLTWLSPQVRAWGGASLFQLEVNGTNEAFDTGYATSVFGALGAGFVLHTPPRTFESNTGSLAALQLGVLIEGGYALRSAIDFRLRTQPDSRRIEVIDASLGSLSLSGPYLRFAAVVRF